MLLGNHESSIEYAKKMCSVHEKIVELNILFSELI